MPVYRNARNPFADSGTMPANPHENPEIVELIKRRQDAQPADVMTSRENPLRLDAQTNEIDIKPQSTEIMRQRISRCDGVASLTVRSTSHVKQKLQIPARIAIETPGVSPVVASSTPRSVIASGKTNRA